MALKFSDGNIETYFSQDKLVVIDFWASWCAHCKRLTPVIETLFEEYGESVNIGKYNVDEEEKMVAQYGIRNIPAIYFVKNGTVIDKLLGDVTKAKIKELIELYK
ncbi:MAG: thioredoxin [Paludibacteraceae bacterium]|nr:thioredoxin [Paludibacteraceae bacterium]